MKRWTIRFLKRMCGSAYLLGMIAFLFGFVALALGGGGAQAKAMGAALLLMTPYLALHAILFALTGMGPASTIKILDWAFETEVRS